MSRRKASSEDELTMCIIETIQTMSGYIFTQLKIDVTPQALIDYGSDSKVYQEAHPYRFYVFKESTELALGDKVFLNLNKFDYFFKNKVKVFYNKEEFDEIDRLELLMIDYS